MTLFIPNFLLIVIVTEFRKSGRMFSEDMNRNLVSRFL